MMASSERPLYSLASGPPTLSPSLFTSTVHFFRVFINQAHQVLVNFIDFQGFVVKTRNIVTCLTNNCHSVFQQIGVQEIFFETFKNAEYVLGVNHTNKMLNM